MANRRIPLEEKIDRQKAVVMAAKDKYDAEMEKLHQLQKKRLEMDTKKLISAFEHSTRSIDEVIAFLKGDNPEDED